MPDKLLTILVIAGIAALLLLIRYLVKLAVYKGADAISNSITERRNAKCPEGSTSLADRYRETRGGEGEQDTEGKKD